MSKKFINKKNIGAQILTGFLLSVMVLSFIFGALGVISAIQTADNRYNDGSSTIVALWSFGVTLVSSLLYVVIKLLTKIAENSEKKQGENNNED